MPESPPNGAPAQGPKDGLYTAQDLFGDLVDEPLEPTKPAQAAGASRAVKVKVAERKPPGGLANPPVDMSADEMAGLIDAFGGGDQTAQPLSPPVPSKGGGPLPRDAFGGGGPTSEPKPRAAPAKSAGPVQGEQEEFDVLLEGLSAGEAEVESVEVAPAPAVQKPRATPKPAKSEDFGPLLDQLTASPQEPSERFTTETATVQNPDPPSPLEALADLFPPMDDVGSPGDLLGDLAAPQAPPRETPPARPPAARHSDEEIDQLLSGVMSDAEQSSPAGSARVRFNADPPSVVRETAPLLDLGALADEAVASSLEGELGGAVSGPPASFGPYKLVEKIAAGGMAEVFKAKRTGVEGFEKVLALKRILPHLSDNKEFVEMFIDEAKMVAGLTHPNIVQIFDLGKIDGTYFIAMEYVHGKDLRTILKRAKEKGLRIPLDLCVLIVSKVCSALESAHRKRDEQGQPLRIVHRDVSPQNILISFEGEVKLTDFGIAKATSKASSTDRGALRGKLLYMSPEQASGHPMDRRSDVFSLGVVFYEMITDTKLFLGSSEKGILEMVRECHVERPRALNPKIPEILEKVVLKALEKDPERRYQDASEMNRGLERALRERQPPASTELARFMEVLFETGSAMSSDSRDVDDSLEIDLSPAEPPEPLSEAGDGPEDDDDDLEDLFKRVGK